MHGVPTASLRRFACLLQSCGRELPDGLDHAEPILLEAAGDHQPGRVHQLADGTWRLLLADPGHRLDVGHAERRVERAEQPQGSLLAGPEQVVTGSQHIGELAAALGAGRVVLQQCDPLLQDLAHGQCPDPACDQLDGQRQPA